MKHLKLFIFICLFIFHVPAFTGQKEYDDCILKHMKGVKLDIAAHAIKQACKENYNKAGVVSDNKRAYNNCLLEHLPGVESLQAVLEIKSSCKSRFK